MTDWDSFIRRRIIELSGNANVGDIVFMSMNRESSKDKFFVEMAICINLNYSLMEVGYLTDEPYMSRYDLFDRQFTILVRGAASPQVMAQFFEKKESLRYLLIDTGKNDIAGKIANYQYLRRNAAIPTQEQAKRIIGLPENF